MLISISVPCTRFHPRARNEDFGQFLASLDPWEKELLHHVQLRQYDIFSVMKQIAHGFIAASDGSVRYKTDGSFGWIVSTPSGERLVRAYGQVRGAFLTSYRAEAYGMLSVLRFIVRVQEYCQILASPDWQWTATSDNLSLVDGTQEDGTTSKSKLHDWTHWDANQSDMDEIDKHFATQFTHGQPNPTLEPDWDVLHEIQWTISTDLHGAGGTIVHTKGHQDDKAK